ncbi:FtsX-like permease family protein [Intestinibacter sp.]|uniref:ABC transporter permease n=1 Tax=Intestinibacter sp. TaxID=1965304 RepID=UPI003F13BA52
MIKKLIWNDIKNNRFLSVTTTIFMTVSAMLIALTILLFTNLLGAIDNLMMEAKTPDFLQMHAGTLDENEILNFVEEHTEISDWQISRFLNLENSSISLGDYNLADSTQDNGLTVQGESFDYLLDMENRLPEVSMGEVYVPVCYRAQYNLKIGDTMKIGSEELVIGGFIRDSQMNSMMSSSKRFLVNKIDYEKIKKQGEEEFLIEFLMQDEADVATLESAYAEEGLPANGPTITKPLIRMLNALSDGMMIFVIFFISIVVLLISMLCIRFILSLRMEKDKKEVGMLKALGIQNKEIRKLYFAKYILLSVCGAVIGLFIAYLLQSPLAKQMQDLYGVSDNDWKVKILSVLSVILVEAIILFSILHNLKKTEKYSVLEALFSVQENKKGKWIGQYLFIGFVVAFCTFLMLLPQNLYSTLSSPKFVTYMGIGDGEIRIDVRQKEEIDKTTTLISNRMKNDMQVEKYAVLQTKSFSAFLDDGTSTRLTVELGNHTVFPVSYVKGTSPKKEGEIALSTLNAEELGLSINDKLQLLVGDKKEVYTVCGIYSDITNGGKTAKAINISGSDDIPTIWSILYVSLNETASKERWIEDYSKMGVDVVDIEAYVEGTYGQTLKQINLASKVAIGVAVFIIFVVVTLFMRLIVEKNRYSISLQKALGFTTKSINKSYMEKGLLSAVIGIISGLLIGNIFGESICGIILKSFGADGFEFVIAWEKVLFLIPAISLVVASIAIWTGILEIKKIKAFECCLGKE